MAQTIDKFHLHILRIIHTLERVESEDMDRRLLTLTSKRKLAKLDSQAWSKTVGKLNLSIEDYFYETEIYTFTHRERLILFLIFDYCAPILNDELLEVINYFADAFNITDVNPLNYGKYLDMLTDSEILAQIISADAADLIYLLTSIIEHVSLEDLKTKSYEGALKILCKVNDRPYSPIFKGDYSIQNVYETIRKIVEDENCRPFLTPKDISKIELLLEIDSIATSSFQKSFARKMQELESHFEYRRINLTLAVAKLIPSLLFEARTSKYREEMTMPDSEHKI